eukprot:gnl/TRDRNA2_/TRDRNA2_170707_c2_seq5.p1 gnl/TRDRNA2_/TRDRNA2_170707_c2~~gnl/TRDRNA2_/TRDRNA2_170707_c2_seq5.p1  ORF type:complete len:246 (-),score=34.11 gnl/TRDRNA2_/TRDRNA2_170707_c2_seq5:105-842(-)
MSFNVLQFCFVLCAVVVSCIKLRLPHPGDSGDQEEEVPSAAPVPKKETKATFDSDEEVTRKAQTSKEIQTSPDSWRAEFGIPARLPKFNVSFGTRSVNEGEELSKSETSKVPKFSYDPSKVHLHPRAKIAVVLVDPDAPYRQSNAMFPGPAGPWLHWLLTDGKPSLSATREEMIKIKNPKEHLDYMGPSPPKGRHRYIAVMFEQIGEVLNPFGVARKSWDFPDFVKANSGVLRPVAMNYFYCSAA